MLTFDQGLVVDLIKAKLNALKALGMEEDPEVTELVQVEAEGIKDAFINFLTNPLLNFTVSELRASVEIEEFKTDDLSVNLSPESLLGEYGPVLGMLKKLSAAVPGAGEAVDGLESAIKKAMAPGLQGGATVPAIDARKDGGPSGKIKAIGHAHVGLKDPDPNSDTTDSENDFTKVKLYRDKIPS